MEAEPRPESQFEALKRTHRAATEASNRGDIEEAWGNVPEEFEFHLASDVPEMPEGGLLRGPDEIVRYMRTIRETFPDWGAEPQEYVDLGDDNYLIHMRVGGTGPYSGISAGIDWFQIWEIRDGVPVRMREFHDRAEAEQAAGTLPEDE